MAEEQEKLSASQRSRIRRISAPKELSPDEEGGELNIVPFLDIIMNVLMFVLATISVTFTTIIETTPPSIGGGHPKPSEAPKLSLNVVIIDKGFVVSAYGQHVGEGCQGIGTGATVGRSSDGRDYDYAGLTACAARLKEKVEGADEETSATLTANANIQYQVIISTIDALRKSDSGKELFPDINFGVPQ
jgi:biopolymer transport protein ExbD